MDLGWNVLQERLKQEASGKRGVVITELGCSNTSLSLIPHQDSLVWVGICFNDRTVETVCDELKVLNENKKKPIYVLLHIKPEQWMTRDIVARIPFPKGQQQKQGPRICVIHSVDILGQEIKKVFKILVELSCEFDLIMGTANSRDLWTKLKPILGVSSRFENDITEIQTSERESIYFCLRCRHGK